MAGVATSTFRLHQSGILYPRYAFRPSRSKSVACKESLTSFQDTQYEATERTKISHSL